MRQLFFRLEQIEPRVKPFFTCANLMFHGWVSSPIGLFCLDLLVACFVSFAYLHVPWKKIPSLVSNKDFKPLKTIGHPLLIPGNTFEFSGNSSCVTVSLTS